MPARVVSAHNSILLETATHFYFTSLLSHGSYLPDHRSWRLLPLSQMHEELESTETMHKFLITDRRTLSGATCWHYHTRGPHPPEPT